MYTFKKRNQIDCAFYLKSFFVTPNLQSSNFLMEDLREIWLFVKETIVLLETPYF